MKLLEVAKTILGLLPAIIAAVKAVEEALPQAGQGAVKLKLVMDTIEAGYKVATDTVATFEQVAPALSSAVSSVVGAFNQLGLFVKQG